MGNFSKGVTSESSKVVARCPVRNMRAEAQSLNPSPFLSSQSCTVGTANAPSAITGVTLSNSRRLIWRNLFCSTFRSISLPPDGRCRGRAAMRFPVGYKVSGNQTWGRRIPLPRRAKTIHIPAPSDWLRHRLRCILSGGFPSKFGFGMLEQRSLAPKSSHALSAEPGDRVPYDSRQRGLMVGALCLLLLALGIVLWHDRDFWFPDTADAESDSPETTPVANLTPVELARPQIQAHSSAKARHRSAAAIKAVV